MRQAQTSATKPYLAALIVLAVVALGLLLYIVITVALASSKRRAQRVGVDTARWSTVQPAAGAAAGVGAGTAGLGFGSAGVGAAGGRLGFEDASGAWGFPPLPNGGSVPA